MVAPNVTVTINDQSIYAQPNPTTIPLFVFATRTAKLASDGSGTAQGTIEANKLRVVTSQRELTLNYGDPVFVTSAGDPIHGEETNEYGLNAAYNFLAQVDQAYVVRADIDLGELVASTTEPAFPAPDGTYWIEKSAVVGGIFKWDGASYVAMPFTVFTTPPQDADGVDGDWAFDYTSDFGTIIFKNGGKWRPASNDNLSSELVGATMSVAPTSPLTPTVGDFWYKTTSSAGGTNLKLARYRAVDGRWVSQVILRDMIPPVPNEGILWEDLSQIATSGNRAVMVGTGSTFIALEMFVQDTQPTTEPDEGTRWVDDTLTDFALYVEGGDIDGSFGNQWVPVETTTNSNPSHRQKVISASAPRFPQQGAIWTDLSTPENIDNYPTIKRFAGADWVDITDAVMIQPEDPIASVVLNGTYWLNNGESRTRNTVKKYNSAFQPSTVVFDANTGKYEVVTELDNKWEPAAGDTFGRKSQREVVVEALQSAFNSNQDIRNEIIYFQLIACPGYPELYDEMISLNNDNGETAFVVSDPSKFMIPSGIPQGREVTASEWITNANNVTATGEDGFAASPSAFAGIWYPWGLSSDVNGNDVFVPPSHAVLRMIGRSDQMSAPWFPPAGFTRGIVDSFTSVGHLTNEGDYNPLLMTTSQLNILYDQKINPITFKPNRGLIAWGQKTMSAQASAMDRVNVARLLAKMKYDLKVMMEPFLFELNDAITRRSALVVAERYLAGLKSLRALYDFAARCDEINNTPARIDRNELWVDVAIKPAKSVEFIFVPISILNTGDSFPF